MSTLCASISAVCPGGVVKTTYTAQDRGIATENQSVSFARLRLIGGEPIEKINLFAGIKLLPKGFFANV